MMLGFQGSNSSSKVYHCVACSAPFTGLASLLVHQATHAAASVKVPSPPQPNTSPHEALFSSMDSSSEHPNAPQLLPPSPSPSFYICDCGEEFQDFSLMLEHKRSHVARLQLLPPLDNNAAVFQTNETFPTQNESLSPPAAQSGLDLDCPSTSKSPDVELPTLIDDKADVSLGDSDAIETTPSGRCKPPQNDGVESLEDLSNTPEQISDTEDMDFQDESVISSENETVLFGPHIISEHIHRLIMERGKHKPENVMEDGLSRELMNAGRFCFSCEQIFASRKCLEEHVCSATSYICSCGTEFTEYKDMLMHSTTHEPGHQVLDHQTIKKRRLEKLQEEEEKLNRLQKGEVVWKAPKLAKVASIDLPLKPMFKVSSAPQVPEQSALISQVPDMNPSLSETSFITNPASSATEMKNIFTNVGAPTVDLWTIYQPVVLLETERIYNRKKPYTCGKCEQCFMTKTSLISHHSTHVTDKVSGCIGCGLLLSSKKLVPRFHSCNSPSSATKFRIVTARPLRINHTNTDGDQKWSAMGPQATSSMKMKNLSTFGKGIKTTRSPSTLQVKYLNNRKYNRSNEGFHVSPHLQLKSRNPGAFRPRVISHPMSKRQSLNQFVTNGNTNGLPVTPSQQLKVPINSSPGVWSKTTKSSSAPNAFTCRVCHIPFETAQLLQRHKCIKAQEFMAQHAHCGKQQYKLKRVTPALSPNPTQLNGERKLGVPASGNIKKNQVIAIGLDKAIVPGSQKTAVDMEDDCYIVESEPEKPAEMIYQVTSSVPIKT